MKEKHRKINIQNQLLSRFFVILLGLLIVLTIYENRSLKGYIYRSKAEDLNERVLNINKDILIDDGKDTYEKLLNEVRTEDVSVAIISEDGTVKCKKKSNTLGTVIELSEKEYLKIIDSKEQNIKYKILKDGNGNEQIVIWRIVNILDNNGDRLKGLIQISTLTNASNEILHDQIKMFLIAVIFILFFGIILAYNVSKYTLKPLREITKQINEFNAEKVNERIDVHTKQNEIVILKNSFNNMLTKVEDAHNTEKKLNENMRRFIMDASHELRTPLTAISGFIEVLEMGAKDNKEKLEMALHNMYKETERLTKLVNNLLFITKIEGGATFEVKNENIANAINEIKEQLLILKGNRKLIFNLDDNVFLNINKDHIKQIVYNLVQNAINHTDEKCGIIKIGLIKAKRDNKNYAIFSVSDNGEGISKENLDNIFNRFFRSKEDRQSKRNGYGLGLSIVKSIVHKYNGEISVQSVVAKGTVFTVIFEIKDIK